MKTNILLNTDSYKASHADQYPLKTEIVYSYIESRGGKWDKLVFFGLQMFLKEYLTKPITVEMLDEAEEFWAAHGEPFNRARWEYILEVHNGYLPIRIEAIPEGSVVQVSTPLVVVYNTDPACWWLTSFLETSLLRAVWYPTTVATNSYEARKVIYAALQRTSDNPDMQIDFKMQDFGARGVSSLESAGIGGCAHLINFKGTDTVEGVLYARRYYDEPMAGFSIPAAEHSTITSWGRDGEVDAYRNMLKQFGKPGALLAVVSDSYDLWNAVSNIWGGELRQEVIDSGATLVVRPDSGDPRTVPVECVRLLAEKFGTTKNDKGYAVLNHVRVIQGDGINIDTLPVILENLEKAGFSADNLSFGQGGGLLQQVDRDTLKFAMKCSAIRVDGVWRDVYKDPKTDPGKTSKKGRFKVENVGGAWCTAPFDGGAGELVPVFDNGKLLVDHKFADIRQRIAAAAKQKR